MFCIQVRTNKLWRYKVIDYYKIAKEIINSHITYRFQDIEAARVLLKASKKDRFREIPQFLTEYEIGWNAQKEFSGALKEWNEAMTEQLEELLKKLNRRIK